MELTRKGTSLESTRRFYQAGKEETRQKMSIEQATVRRDESTAGPPAVPQRPVSKAFITIDQLRNFGKRGKWGKKDRTDSTKRAELDIEMFTSKSCETHKDGPCPPDCPHTLNKETGMSRSVTAQATAVLKNLTDSLAKREMSVENIQLIEMSKALTTRNFVMPRISAMRARYDANQIVRSAMTQTTRSHSALAPPVQETLDHVAQTEPARTQPIMRSLCAAHGLAFKSDQGCHACTVAKSLETVRPDARHHLR